MSQSASAPHIPSLRFPEFSGEWEEKRLIELSENGFSNGAFNDPKKVGYGYRIINVKDMYVDGTIDINNLTRVGLDEKEFLKNQVEYGDIFFTRSSLVKEGIAYSNVNLNDANDLTFDGHLIRMRPIKEYYFPSFLYYNFTTKKSRKQFVVRGKTTTMTTIGQEDIASVVITLPKLPEQTKIAAFLSAVDSKIDQLSQKKTLLEQYKKGIMQQIFSQQIRFKADDGSDYPEWEEKKLGDVGRVAMCKRILKDQTLPFGDIPFYKIGTFGKEPDAFISTELYEEYKIKYSHPKVGDVLISASGTIGRTVVYDGLPAYFQDSNIVWIDNDEQLVKNSFLYFFYETVVWNTEDTTIARLYNDNLKSIRIEIPCFEEQTKIANFLSAINTKIEQVAEQLEAAKQFKKGLLQQMFV